MLEELYISFILITIGALMYGAVDLFFKIGDYLYEKKEQKRKEKILLLLFQKERGRKNGTYR